MNNILIWNSLPKLALVSLVAFSVGCQRNTPAPASELASEPAAAAAAEPKLVDTARIAAETANPATG
ncbi:hypothetical protein [Nevskia ramosa]|uniref:hypothetical protein n=1 Tax=Nevskia ramosa TaxID=64002 RepID=UPI00235706FC|nr:hypothetical protein [Nevskia ramosa]